MPWDRAKLATDVPISIEEFHNLWFQFHRDPVWVVQDLDATTAAAAAASAAARPGSIQGSNRIVPRSARGEWSKYLSIILVFCDPAGVVDPAWILLLTLGFAGLFACIGNTGTLMTGLHPDMRPWDWFLSIPLYMFGRCGCPYHYMIMLWSPGLEFLWLTEGVSVNMLRTSVLKFLESISSCFLSFSAYC